MDDVELGKPQIAPRHDPDHLTNLHPKLGRSRTVTVRSRPTATVSLQTTLLAAWETQRNLAAPTNTTPCPLIRSVSRGFVASLSDNRAP
jgi:hypothetical protein